jgi:hypothetical protein
MAKATMTWVVAVGLLASACSPDSGGGSGDGASGGTTGAGGTAGNAGLKQSSVIVTNEKAWDVAIDGDTLYWTSTLYPMAGVRKSKRDGSGVVTLHEEMLASFERMAMDATNVYAIDALGGQIVAVPKAGGSATVLVPMGTYSFLGAQGIAVDDANVYFLGLDSMNAGVVGKVPKTGGPATVLVTGAHGVGLALDAANVYFPTQTGAMSTLSAVPKAGGMATVLSPNQCNDARIVGTKLYCTQGLGLVVHDLASPAASMQVLAGVSGTTYAIDGDDVFVPEVAVTESTNLIIAHSSLSGGGAATPYAQAGTHPLRLAVDAASVFFTDLDDGSIRVVQR